LHHFQRIFGGKIDPNEISDVRRIVSLFLNLLRHRHKRHSSSAQGFNLGFIHKSISAAKLLYREAVRSPGLLGLGFCQKQFALKAGECDDLSTWIARYSFSSVPVGRPFSIPNPLRG
jgi:hypothetical protein